MKTGILFAGAALTAAVWAFSSNAAGISVDTRIPAGCVKVVGVTNDVVTLTIDNRDSSAPWIYWAFRVTGAEGRTLRFAFTDRNAVGSRGAAVSTDRGATWTWSDDVMKGEPKDALGDHASWREFNWTFAADQREVWFSQMIPYGEREWKAFLARHEKDRGKVFETDELCRTRKGRSVEYARFGRLDGQAKERLFVTARHHCAEASASFVVEGMLERFFADDEFGVWLRENMELRVVPFVDKDGVVDGDQGKGRRPWDPGRDYTDNREQRYPQVAAIMRMVREWRPTGMQDTHSPWLRGNWTSPLNANEYCYQPYCIENAEKARVYGEIVQRLSVGRMNYRVKDDYPFGKGWNTWRNYAQGASIKGWASKSLPFVKLSTTWEIPFANQREKTLYPDDFRAFGGDVLAGWREYLLR